MPRPYLEVTYRQGKPFAAYLYLERRTGDTAARTERHSNWVIDFASDGRPIGIEFIQIGAVNLSELNRALEKTPHPLLTWEDIAPLSAA